MNRQDFCAIYQLAAVNSVVVTQSQESGGMKKKAGRKEEGGRQKAPKRRRADAIIPSLLPVKASCCRPGFVLDNEVKLVCLE